jgi:hypothetical protein
MKRFNFLLVAALATAAKVAFITDNGDAQRLRANEGEAGSAKTGVVEGTLKTWEVRLAENRAEWEEWIRRSEREDKERLKRERRSVDCCIKGKCERISRGLCESYGGKIVRDCQGCKPLISCCTFYGRCKKITETECSRGKGIVVKDCKYCRPAR